MAEGCSASSEVDDSDIPPLEDMTELIDQVNMLRKDVLPGRPMESSKIPTDPSTKKITESSSKNHSLAQSQSQKSFGGFKKGFLNNPKPKKGKSPSLAEPRKKDDIPVIKPKNPEQKNKGMEIPEVQEAMKSNIPSLENKDWITEDLLKKIEGNPSLAKLLMDPKFTAALSQVQTDPMKAMAMLSSNPEMQKALQEFSALLGEHFTSLGNSAVGMKSTVSQDNDIGLTERASARQQPPVPPSPEDQAKMQEILSDPEVMRVLQDHQIQKLLTMMKTNPDAAQLEVKNANADMRAKIQKLVEVGLLGFAH